MKMMLLMLFCAVFYCFSPFKATSQDDHDRNGSSGHAQHEAAGETGTLIVETEPIVPKAGEAIALKLMVHDTDGAMVRDYDVIHEKLVHLILVREGLDEFAHLHPAVDDSGNLSVTHSFPQAGTYRLFADYKRKGQTATVAKAVIDISGDRKSPPALVVNAPGDVIAEGLQAKIELRDLKVGGESQIRFRLSHETGKSIEELQPYLGARGHLVVLSADGTQYVHAHPSDSPTAENEVVFGAHFPSEGLYKGWAQFQIAGQLRTLPFVVEVP
jgi:hypothetical protein